MVTIPTPWNLAYLPLKSVISGVQTKSLEIIHDSYFTFLPHILAIRWSKYFENIQRIPHILFTFIAISLLQSSFIFCLNYCSSLLTGLSASDPHHVPRERPPHTSQSATAKTFMRSPHSSAQHPPAVSPLNQRKRILQRRQGLTCSHSSPPPPFPPSSFSPHSLRSVHTDWALLQTCERASILGCFSAWLTLSTESTSSSLSFFGSLFQWCFLSESSSYPLFKMALPLSLSLTCFLHASPLDKLYISLFIILMVSSLPLEYKLSESRLLPILASVISKLPTTTLCKKQLNKCYWTNDWILISLRLM